MAFLPLLDRPGGMQKNRSRWMICRIFLSFFQAVNRRQPLSRTGISLLCKEIVAEGMG